jgi:pyridoxine 4-dehydrogenase
VAINWLLCKGSLPIPGAKDPRQARENAGAMGWRLTPGEQSELEEAAPR